MASEQKEASKCEFYATDVPASDTKNDDMSLASVETEDFEGEPHVGPVDTVGSVYSGITTDSAEMESAGGSKKAGPGDIEASLCSDSDDSKGGRSEQVNTVVVLDKKAAFECYPCAVDLVNPVNVQATTNEQDGALMASTRAEGFEFMDYDTPAVDFRVSTTKEGSLISSPKAPKIKQEASVLSLENYEVHVAVPSSSTHLKQEVTSAAISQEESFEVGCATDEREDGKLVDDTFQSLEEKGAENSYDIDFDIDEHEIFDTDCMFPALDADKTEDWHAGVDDVIMEESSDQLDSNQHADLDMKSIPGESNSESVALNDIKENVASKEGWLHDSQQQSGCKTVSNNAVHGVEESSVLRIRHVQGFVELAGYAFNETDIETLASGVVHDEELACDDSKDANAQECDLQYDADEIFASLSGENVETVHDEGTCEAKGFDEIETKMTIEEDEIDPTSINTTHQVAAVNLYELDQDLHGGSSVVDAATTNLDPVSGEVELHMKSQGALEGSRLESCTGQEEIVTQADIQGKGASEGSGFSDSGERDECSDIQSNEANADDLLVAKNKASCVDCSGAPYTNSLAITLNGNIEPENASIGSEQENIFSEQEKGASVIVCKEISMEAVSESFTQEEAITFEQTAMHDKLTMNSRELEFDHGTLSHVEANVMHIVQVENQSDEPVVLDGEYVDEFDDTGPAVRNSDAEEICENRDETVEEGKVSEQEQKESIEEHEHSDEKSVLDFDGSVPELRKSDVEEICVLGDEIKEEVNVAEQEEKASKEEHTQSEREIVDDFDGSVAEVRKNDVEEILGSGDGLVEGEAAVPEQEKEAVNAELEDHRLMPLSGSPPPQDVDEFDGSVPEVRKNDVVEILGSRDGIMEGEVAVPEPEKKTVNAELEDHCLMPLAPQVESAEEAKKQEFSSEATIHLPSSSDPETNVSSCTDLTEKMRVSDGLKDSEKSAAQSAAPLEQSKELIGVSADASSKKPIEKGISDHKLRKAEISNKLIHRAVKKTKEGGGNKYVGELINANRRPELEEEISEKKVQKPVKEGFVFGIGDLVWAKVRSHPWWPAQIFDPADASKSARKAKKSGRVLVAFFGDCTFAWLQQSQMIAFCPNFKEKVDQTTMKIFCLAVEEALEELCRRSELGLSCKHFKGSLHSTSSFPDANTGIREGVRAERLKDIRASAEMFRPKKTLEFVRSVACSPLGAWSSTLQWAESRGHAYGLRTCMVALQGLDSAPVLLTPPAAPSQGLKLKRRYSSLNEEDLPETGGIGKGSKKTKKLKSDKDRNHFEGLRAKAVPGAAVKRERVALGNDVGVKSSEKDSTVITERSKDGSTFKIILRKTMRRDHLSSSERHLDTASAEEAGGERILDDSKETLLAIAGRSVKVLKRSSLKEEKVSSTSKKVRRQIEESQQNDTSTFSMHQAVKGSHGEGVPDSDAEALIRAETDTEDVFTVLPSPSRDGAKKTEVSKKSVEIESKKEVTVKDNIAEKSESVRKLSKVGDSIKKVASELTVTKPVDDARLRGLEAKKKMKESALERQASPMRNKDVSKESSEDVSLLQLRRDLEVLAKKAGSDGAKAKAVKQSKKGGRVEAAAARSSPHWQSVPHKSQRSCVQELALAARKRKSEIAHDEGLAKLPKNSSTTGSQRHHVSKGYITSAEKPGERRSYDKSLLLHSRRPAPPASSMKSPSQRYNEKLSSHMPLGLFMRFPEDFPLPSEAQLKAIFIPFGPLQMSATRLYKDSASAQVVFKHGRDAESALKHAKKSSMFGQVAVTYRLRHPSNSARAETKTDSHSSYMAALKESAPSKEKSEGSNVSLAGDREVVSLVELSPGNQDMFSGSEPTGDIQDQMMTLLRQVSVIVKTSPVTSDGT